MDPDGQKDSRSGFSEKIANDVIGKKIRFLSNQLAGTMQSFSLSSIR